ncbi:HigA family addiction module antitoxin [Xenorhabdus szentirmaii]|uniref:HigA family addiction module antitoxin n=1 Tax=Xenorhabdus szentirmaii TaxID=290112 RepID=UPI00199B5D5C|nr:HigA family addiction module antitoxin [Xenorhabdus sp. 38]MBD2779885.1 HigA family addiction module antidote protein [Xenorhabdus sp. 38]
MVIMHNPPHPGELIKDAMETLDMSARALAKALDVAPSTVQRLISHQSHVSPEIAVRLSVVIGSAPHVWLGMQNAYDIWHIKQNLDTSRLKRLSVA